MNPCHECCTALQDSFLDEGFILDKKIGVGQPHRITDAKVLIANTPMDTDKIKIYGARVRVDSMAKVGNWVPGVWGSGDDELVVALLSGSCVRLMLAGSTKLGAACQYQDVSFGGAVAVLELMLELLLPASAPKPLFGSLWSCLSTCGAA